MNKKRLAVVLFLAVLVVGGLLAYLILSGKIKIGANILISKKKGSVTYEAQSFLDGLKVRVKSNYANNYQNISPYGFQNILKDVSDNGNSNDLASFAKVRDKSIRYLAALKGYIIKTPEINFAAPTLTPEKFSPIEEESRIEGATNLLRNPGFETLSSGAPASWSMRLGSMAENPIDKVEKRSGNNSWQFTKGWAYSDFIPVSQGVSYAMSAWVKSSDANQYAKFYLYEYNAEQKILGGPLNQGALTGNSKEIIPTDWTKFLNGVKLRNSKAKYVKVAIYAPINSSGKVWFDDLFFGPAKEFLDQKGCANNSTSKCLDLGSSNENAGGSTFSPSPADMISAKASEEGITYRTIGKASAKTSLEVSFPAFGSMNENGTFSTPMLLEIKYKDIYDDRTAADAVNSGNFTYSGINAGKRVIVSSKIDYQNTDPLFPVVSQDQKTRQILYLGGTNSSAWTYKQYVFQNSHRQMLKAIDGKVSIIINLPKEVIMPIDYISLKQVSDDEARTSIIKDRQMVGGQKIIMPTQSAPESSYKTKNLAVFSRDMVETIYPYSKPKEAEDTSDINLISTIGETEAVNLGIYSFGGQSNLSLSAGDLINEQGEKISKEAVKFSKTVFNERMVRTKSIADLPDYIEPLSTFSIPANSTAALWLKIYLPQMPLIGVYSGDLNVLDQSGKILKSVKIKLEVVPITLSKSKAVHSIYYDPYSMVYSTDNDQVIGFYKEMGVEPKITTNRDDILVVVAADGKISDFDLTAFDGRLKKLSDGGLLAGDKILLSIDNEIKKVYKKIPANGTYNTQDPDLYAKLSSDEFSSAFGLLVKKLSEAGSKYQAEFIFSIVDEPGKDVTKRLIADRIYKIIKDNGAKTWVTATPTLCGTVNIPSVLNNSADPASGTRLQYSGVPENKIPELLPLLDYPVWEGVGKTCLSESELPNYNFGAYTTGVTNLRLPIYQRFIDGIYSFATNSKIIGIYAMGTGSSNRGDEYNDFDINPFGVFPWIFPDVTLGYPTWNGKLLPSLTSEGIREGIKDSKYLATLEEAINKALGR